MYTIGDIHQMAESQFLQCHDPASPINHLLVDSRQLQQSADTMFFALSGLRQDGHQFIQELYQKGVRNFMVSKSISLESIPEANVLRVNDVIRSLQRIAAKHRAQFNIPVIGITGSNGKTIVKEWLSHLLFHSHDLVKSPKSFNSQIGVPLSVWQMQGGAEIAIFEAGISTREEMQHLQPVIDPTIGVFTNIGSAHEEGFEDIQQKVIEKSLLFADAKCVICRAEHDLIVGTLGAQKIPLFRWSTIDRTADLYLAKMDSRDGGSIYNYVHAGGEGTISIPFDNNIAEENALHCLAVVIYMGLDEASWKDRFKSLPVVEMRLEAKEGINNCLIINDVYSADLPSLSGALSFARQQNQHRKRTLILSEFEQHAGSKEKLYSQIAGMIVPYGFDRVFLIGADTGYLSRHLAEETCIVKHYLSTEELLEDINQLSFRDELILVKGARSHGLERISDQLSLKQHQTILEVNLGALARNLKKFETKLKPGVKIMSMVKAAAYGSGAVEIARFLESRNLDYLAVAYADEGVELREAGITLPIMVLSTDQSSIPLLIKYDLEPEVFSIEQLDRVAAQASHHGKQLPVHLKLETGMHRLGFEAGDMAALNARLRQWRGTLAVQSVFSHLAVSDDMEELAFTRQQIESFKRLSQMVDVSQQSPPILHILNSHGVLNFPEDQFDMVRLGVGMYGIGAFRDMDLEVVHHLKSTILQIKTVKPGATIGYGRTEHVREEMRIATVGIGYADGLIRKAGNRRYALIVNGVEAPIVGNICMDMTMIDVTHIPNASVGSVVTIFGANPRVDALAIAAETIPYEVFTNISKRVKRLYIYD